MEDAVILGRASGGGRAGGTGSIDRDGGGGGVRAGDAGLNGRATGGRAGRWDAQGQASGAGSVGRAGGARGVRACGGTPGSVGRLERWVQVMNSGAIYSHN
jgi:hypothetical protein